MEAALIKALDKVSPETYVKVNDLGQNICDSFQMVFGPLASLGRVLRAGSLFLEEKVATKIQNIPLEKKQEPPLQIAYQVLDSIKYIENDDLKDLFAKLLAASANKDYNYKIHPSFIGELSKFSPDDAKFVDFFIKEKLFYNLQPIGLVKIRPENIEGYINRCTIVDFDYHNFSISFEVLKRMGFLKEDYLHSLSNKSMYGNIKDEFEKTFKQENIYNVRSGNNFWEIKESNLKNYKIDEKVKLNFELHYGVFETTIMGKHFFECLKD